MKVGNGFEIGRVLTLGTIVLTLLAACGGNNGPISAPTKHITWTAQSSGLPETGVTKSLIWFADELNKRTKGEITLKVYPNAGLQLNSAQMVSLTSRRAVDVGELGVSVAGEFPEIGVASIPGLVPYNVPLREKITNALMPSWNSILESKWNQVLVQTCPTDPRSIILRKPITSLSALKGLKLRASGTAEVALTKSLGAIPTSVAVADYYTSLQTGVIDGIWGPPGIQIQAKLYEVAKYLLAVSIGGSVNTWTINKDALNELSPSTRKIVLDTAKEGSHYCATLQDQIGQDALKSLPSSYGVTVTPLSPQDKATLKQLTAPLVDEWAKSASPEGLKELAIVKDLVQASGLT
jgi:TRAP-type C4-dicarboxylate transport system substrate-binding protein